MQRRSARGAEFRGSLDAKFEIPVYVISARDPFERGVQYGQQAAEQIEASISYYSRLFASTHGLPWSEISERAGVWESIIEDFDADILAEMKGLAEGSGRSLGEILALNARGEMVYAKFMLADGCTSFARLPSAAGGGAFAGQNWDWRFGARDSRVLLRIEQFTKPTITMVVEAGQVGRHGVNSAGISMFANGLPTRPGAPGVPQAVIRRKTLDQYRVDHALDVIFGAQQQIPANVLLAHAQFAIDIETVPGDRRWTYPDDGVMSHANHYEYFVGPDYQPTGLGTDSLYRSHLVRRGLERLRGEGDERRVLQGIGDVLADSFGHPNAVAVHADEAMPEPLRWSTITSTIVDLGNGVIHLADGPADTNAYRQLPWNVYDERIHSAPTTKPTLSGSALRDHNLSHPIAEPDYDLTPSCRGTDKEQLEP